MSCDNAPVIVSFTVVPSLSSSNGNSSSWSSLGLEGEACEECMSFSPSDRLVSNKLTRFVQDDVTDAAIYVIQPNSKQQKLHIGWIKVDCCICIFLESLSAAESF